MRIDEHGQSMKYVHLVSSYFLSVVFLFTSIDKFFHYKEFLNALASYVLMPPTIAPYLVLPIIFTELWVGVGMLVKRLREPAALTSASLLTIFTLALTLNYFYEPEAICGCWFTITLGTATEVHIIQNLIMVGLAFTVWWRDRNSMTKTVAGSTVHIVEST